MYYLYDLLLFVCFSGTGFVYVPNVYIGIKILDFMLQKGSSFAEIYIYVHRHLTTLPTEANRVKTGYT